MYQGVIVARYLNDLAVGIGCQEAIRCYDAADAGKCYRTDQTENISKLTIFFIIMLSYSRINTNK